MGEASFGRAAGRLACPLALAVASALVALTVAGARESPRASGQTALKQAERAGIDIAGVIETVGHRVEPAKGNRSLLVSQDRLYRAEFGASGFSLTLRRKLSASEFAGRRGTSGRPRKHLVPAQAIPFERAPAFRIETARVLRGARSLARPRDSWHAERNSALRTLAPALSERVTARGGKLEWDFLLDRAPAGRGALTIEAHVSGAGDAERVPGSKPAWCFSVRAGRSITLGGLVVRDARGRALYRALPALAGRKLSLTVPSRILQGASYPLTIDPVVSPEYPASDPVHGGAPGTQDSPALAFDGANYLVVWHDFASNSGAADIYGSRVSPAGSVLDPVGIAISTAPLGQSVPAIAFDGTNYLVAWTDARSGTADIYGTRVSPTGAVLDAGGVAISTAGGNQHSPAIAFDGANYLVVWEDTRSGAGHDVYGSRVSPAGAVLDPSGIAIPSAGNQYVPAIAFDGTNYLVVWEEVGSGSGFAYDISGTRVSPAGDVLDPEGIAISSRAAEQEWPALAFDGTNYLVVWQDNRLGVYYDIFGARVSPAGAVLDPDGIAISTASSSQYRPTVAFDSSNYLVLWEDYRSGGVGDIYASRVNPAGAVLDPAGIAISIAGGTQYGPANVAFDGTNYLVTWSDYRSGASWDAYGARVSPAGSVLDPGGIVLSASDVVNNQYAPAVAFDGTNYLLVWQDFRLQTTNEIYGARVSQSGALLDGGGIAISTAADEQQAPAVAFDGTNYLVVWQDYRSGIAGSRYDIYGARVSPAGAVLDPGGIAISTAQRWQWAPSLAFDGTNYLVAWMDYRSTTSWDVYGARVSPNGGVLDPSGIAISTAADSQQFPALAFDGANYLVAWHDYRSPLTDVYGARVSPAGAVLDPAGIPISTAPSYQLYPSLAFDGTNYLVAWMDYRGGGFDIYGSRVSPAGGVLDPSGIAISTAPNNQFFPALAFDGTNYLAAWQDYRSGTSWDIEAVRVSPGGAVFEPTAVSTAATNELAPSLARGPAGGVVVAYERSATEAPYGGVRRVFVRFVEPSSAVPPAMRSVRPAKDMIPAR